MSSSNMHLLFKWIIIFAVALIVVFAVVYAICIPIWHIANRRAWIEGYEKCCIIHNKPFNNDTKKALKNSGLIKTHLSMDRGNAYAAGYMAALKDFELEYSELDQNECLFNGYFDRDNTNRIAASINSLNATMMADKNR